jgi:hypothetical protein
MDVTANPDPEEEKAMDIASFSRTTEPLTETAKNPVTRHSAMFFI